MAEFHNSPRIDAAYVIVIIIVVGVETLGWLVGIPFAEAPIHCVLIGLLNSYRRYNKLIEMLDGVRQ